MLGPKMTIDLVTQEVGSTGPQIIMLAFPVRQLSVFDPWLGVVVFAYLLVGCGLFILLLAMSNASTTLALSTPSFNTTQFVEAVVLSSRTPISI